MGRSPCCDKTKVTKGPWSSEEDELLKNFVTKFGNGGNWISLPIKAGLNRCGKSCRLRWLNYLRPNIKHGEFTEEEDFIIYSLYHNIGSRWSMIASKLRRRTDNDVKNYWNTKLKKKILAGECKNIRSSSIINNNFGNQASCVNTDYYNAVVSQLANVHVNNNFNLHNINRYEFIIDKKGDEDYDESKASEGSSVTSEYSSQYSGLPTNYNVSSEQKNDEFWMDLFSESFDDVLVGSQLVEEKIREIASILDVFVH